MTEALTLSGWTQPADALSSLLPFASTAFDYSEYTPENVFDALRAHRDTLHVIAWSMGAQLAVMAVLRGALSPKKMTLIAPPFQFVQGGDVTRAMDALTFTRFRDQYVHDTARLSSRFHGLIAKNDTRMREIISQLQHHPQMHDTSRWLGWLQHLGTHSLQSAALHVLPDTLLIHGAKDAIVPVEQSDYFMKGVPQMSRQVWENAAHAPHLHDKLRFVQAVAAHHGMNV